MEVRYKYKGKPRHYVLATSIAEMDQEQRLAYYNFLMGAGDAFAIVPILWKIPLVELDGMTDEERHHLLQCIETGFEKPTEWLLTEYLNFQGPADKMSGSSWAEFYFASTYLNKYRKTKDISQLRKFLACLYFDRSKSFDINKVIINSHQFNNAPAGFIFAAIQSFAGIEERLKTMYTHVFPGDDEKELALAGSESEITWLDITLANCDYDVVQMEQLQQKDMYIVLKAMNMKIEKAKKQKK